MKFAIPKTGYLPTLAELRKVMKDTQPETFYDAVETAPHDYHRKPKLTGRILLVYVKWENRAIRHNAEYHAEEWDSIEQAELVQLVYRQRGWQTWIVTLDGNGR